MAYLDNMIIGPIWRFDGSEENTRAKYLATKLDEDYQKLVKSKIPILGAYDDHDFGQNNADKYFEYKHMI